MSFSTGSSGQSAEINVTPLIDVLLVLLIIFMVIVPQKPIGFRALSPDPAPKSAPSVPDPTTIVLEVHKGVDEFTATYAINGHPIAREDLVSKLKEIYAPRQQRVMFVKGDPELAFNTIAEAISFGRQAMVTDIGVLTPGTERK